MKLKRILVCLSLFALTSCTNPLDFLNGKDKDGSEKNASVASLKVELDKVTYSIGETFDYQNLSVILTKDDKSTLNVKYDGFIDNNIGLKLFDNSRAQVSYNYPFRLAGNYDLYVYLSTNESINDTKRVVVLEDEVVEKQICSLSINSIKTTYSENEVLDLSSLNLNIIYDNGDELAISNTQLEDYNIGVKLLDSSQHEINLNSSLSIGTYKLIVYKIDNSQIKDEIEINVSEEVIGLVGDEDLESLSDSFTFENNSYTASEYRSLKIFENYFNKGTYEVSLNRGSEGYDDHLIFAYNENEKSYYSFGLNLANKLQITRFDGEKLYLVKSFKEVLTGKITLSVAFNSVTGAVDYYLNKNLIFANNISTNGDLKYGFYAGTKGCVFGDVMVNNDDTLYDNDQNNYQIANGTIEFHGSYVEAKSPSALMYVKNKIFTVGEFKATFNSSEATNHVGVAFCIDNNDKTTFFREEDISYYYLCVSINGTLGLYRAANKEAILVKNINTKQYYKDENHTIRVVRDNKKVIHAFFDDAYCFTYIDKHPLKGDKFGIATSSGGVKYYSLSTKMILSNQNEEIKDYDVTSGSFYKNKDFIVANANNSMIVSKTPVGYNGTIEAEIAMGKNYGTGLIFRLTKPEMATYYESENGLSYYWLDIKSSNRIIFGKVANGSVSWTMEKYMPYFMSNASKVKIVLDDNNIYAYFSNILVFHYVDNNPLEGSYYGFRSDSEGASIYGDVTFSASRDHEQNRYLIFGHSYTQLWHRYKEDFAQFNDINDIGIGGSQTGNWSKQYKDEVIAYNPEWGIYWNGINDINVDADTSTMMTNYRNCLDYIKQKCPNFKCVCIAASRCTHEKAMDRFAQISSFNAELKAYCDENDWLIYVDAEKIFCDSSGNPINSYFVDTLHPTAEGYKLVAPLVIDAIENYKK